MTITALKNYNRTSPDMRDLVHKVVQNAIELLQDLESDYTPPSVFSLAGQPVEIYAARFNSKHGAQARQSRFYGIRKLFATDQDQIPAFVAYTRGVLLPAEVNAILSCVFIRTEEENRDGRSCSLLRVFFGKAERHQPSEKEEVFSYRKLELLGTGAKTEIAPAGSGGTPIAIAEPLFAGSPKTMSDEEIAAVLAASGNAVITDRLDTDFRSVFASDKE